MRTFLALVLCVFGAVWAATAPVVLDIGHQSTSEGAVTPDGKLNEYEFWCTYAGEVKAAIESAGYPCVVLNRGMAPTKKPISAACRAAGVVQLNKPDKGAKRYPSTHYPEHIGCGMVSADYAIDLGARCVVFLHLNSTGHKWQSKPAAGLIICNRKLGPPLAESVCEAMRRELPSISKGIKVLPRYIGSQPSAGWMNALDAAGIPAIVFEALYVNNRTHVDFLSSEAHARHLARTLAAGVVDWLRQGEE